MKTCIKCKIDLPEDCFYKWQDGRQFKACKKCCKKYNANYQKAAADSIAIYKKKYYKEKIIERRIVKSELKYGASREERKIKSKTLNQEYGKEYYALNKEKRNAFSRDYAKKNRKKINEKVKERLSKDHSFKLASRLRTLICAHLRKRGCNKTEKAFTLTGCTISELKNHLESLFMPGMSWNNHTLKGWHIDHIKPCSSFDLTKKEEQYKCFHYTNLQPLWAVDNWSKSDKIKVA